MAANLIEKLLREAVDTKGTYAELIVTDGNVAFICNGGSRRSTRNYRLNEKEQRNVEKTLKHLDERCVLFTGSLKRIAFTLSDGRTAIFERDDAAEVVTITSKKVTETNAKENNWVRFLDEQNDVGIALNIKSLKNGRWQVIPCHGDIYKGAMKLSIPVDLQFVIAGDFYEVDGAFDPKYSKENAAGIKLLANLLNRVIGNALHMNFLNMAFFSVLPSSMDDDTELNETLVNSVKEACDLYPLFKIRTGNFVNKRKVAYGTDDVTVLFPQEIAGKILPGRDWIERVTPGSREEYFLMDIGIPCYDRERFLGLLFDESNFDELARILAKQRDRWLREFYIFCSNTIEEEKIEKKVITGFRNIRSMRDTKGKMHFPYEIRMVTDDDSTSSRSVVLKAELISPGGKDDEYSDQIREFFLTKIRLKEFSQKPEMEKLAHDLMTKKQPVDKLYCERLALLARYDEGNAGEIDFSKSAIFPYESSRGMSRTTADNLVIGKPYVKEGNLLATALGRDSIWKGMKKLLTVEELNSVIRFAEHAGAIGIPRVVKQSAFSHKDYEKKLFAAGRRTGRDTDYDYTIPGLDEILKRRSLQLSKLVWNAVLEVENPAEVLEAEYSVNNRDVVNRTESSLILILRERTWVPDKNGKFYMPENIQISEISDDFRYDRRNPILKQLHFGTGLKKREKTLSDMEKLAAKEGLHLVPEEEYQEFLKWKNSRKQGKTRKKV